MNVVKITVLARDLREDLVRDYGAAGLGRCPEFEVGQEFLVTTTGKPDGFCSEAWDCTMSLPCCMAQSSPSLTGDGFGNRALPSTPATTACGL